MNSMCELLLIRGTQYELVAMGGKFYVMDYSKPITKQVVQVFKNLFNAEKFLELLKAPQADATRQAD